jgi:hypothetical protein
VSGVVGRWDLLLAGAVIAGCGSSATTPRDAVVDVPGADVPRDMPTVDAGVVVRHLDLGNTTGGDDDPTLLRAQDGSYYLVFISDRSGNSDLWATHSSDGLAWSTPQQITTNPDDDQYPTLVQTSDGKFHLSWALFQTSAPYTTHLYYAESTDGLTWPSGAQTALTSGLVGDKAPHMIIVGTSELRVYFSSGQRNPSNTANDDLLVMRSPDSGTTWGAPVLIPELSSATQIDRFPWVVQVASTEFDIVFNRQDADNLFDPTSDVFFAVSTDGLTWSSPAQVTSDPSDQIPDLWPNFIYAPVAKQWYASWTSTAFYPGGITVMPAGGAYPAQAMDLHPSLGIEGWSTRVAGPLMVWVDSAATGKPQLYSAMNPL